MNVKMKELGSSEAIINKVSTMQDGGLRITIDLPSTASDLASRLLELKVRSGGVVTVAFVSVE